MTSRIEIVKRLSAFSTVELDRLDLLASTWGMPKGSLLPPTNPAISRVVNILNWVESGTSQVSLEQFFELAQSLKLLSLLDSLPRPQFEMLVFGLNVPHGNLPGNTAPQQTIATALIKWVLENDCDEQLLEILQAL